MPRSRTRAASRKQDRGKPPPAGDGGIVGRTPRLEKLHELLARAVLVPSAVPTHDFKEVADGIIALAAGIEREREIEASLVIEGVCCDAALEVAEIPERGGLLGKLDRRAGAGDRGVVGLPGRDHGEEALGAFK